MQKFRKDRVKIQIWGNGGRGSVHACWGSCEARDNDKARRFLCARPEEVAWKLVIRDARSRNLCYVMT